MLQTTSKKKVVNSFYQDEVKENNPRLIHQTSRTIQHQLYQSDVDLNKYRKSKQYQEDNNIQLYILKNKDEKTLIKEWESVINDWIKYKKDKKVIILSTIGIPVSLRKIVWRLTLPNQLAITPELYEIFLEQGITKEKQKSNKLTNIDFDINRTYTNLNLFHSTSPLRISLKNVLLAFSCMRPDIGYVQGMTYIAGLLLMHFEEYDAFIHFSILMTSKSLLDIFRLKKLEEKFERFESIIQKNDMEIYQYLQKQGISSDSYLLDWLMTLFSKCLNPDKVSRIWDMIFVQGSQMIWKTAVGILIELRQNILKSNMEEIYRILKNVDKYINSENELIDKIIKVQLDYN